MDFEGFIHEPLTHDVVDHAAGRRADQSERRIFPPCTNGRAPGDGTSPKKRDLQSGALAAIGAPRTPASFGR
jgi:hypothetical protein